MSGDINLAVESMSVTLSQPADCCADHQNDRNYATIETQDGGAGKYFVLTTERWSFDTVEQLTDLVAAARAGLDAMEATP